MRYTVRTNDEEYTGFDGAAFEGDIDRKNLFRTANERISKEEGELHLQILHCSLQNGEHKAY